MLQRNLLVLYLFYHVTKILRDNAILGHGIKTYLTPHPNKRMRHLYLA